MKLAYDRSLRDRVAVEQFREEFLCSVAEEKTTIGSGAAKSLKASCDLEKKLEEIRADGLPKEPASRKAVLYLIEQLKAAGYQGCDIAAKLGISRMTYYRFMRSAE